MCDSTSSALVTTIPQVYGTLLSDSAWTLNMRFRSFIWPDNLPHNLICKCSREITTTHLLNCKHCITFRSKVHDAARDQLYCMCKSHRIKSFLEPLLSNLFDAEDDFHENNRGDVILPGLDGSFILLDVMSVDPCNVSNVRLVNSEIHNPLSNAENFKFKKYNEPLSKLASLQHAKYNLYPFVFSLFVSLSPTALRFLDDFEMIVKRRTGRNFNRLFWQNRIVFSIFKGMLKMVSDALLSLGSHYERVASSVFALGEMDFLDCRQQGHNARTCPNVGKNDAANSETKCKRKFIRRKESKVEPINNAPQVVAKPVSNRLKHKTCNTCGISFRKNAKGKTSDRCLKCRIVDNYHPPIRIPQEIHPTKCNEFALVFQRFLDQLCKGKYAINIIWEFFGSFCPPFAQNFVSNSEDLTNIAPRNQSSEKLSKIFEDKCFDNKWSKALSALSPGVKAPNNENTVDKLKILHPYEDPVMDQNFYGTYWENYPLMPSEVFSVIKKRPRGKSAGLSGITIDHVKAAIISSEDCLGLLTKFFNQILSGQRKYPEELRSSRLTALVKNSKMDVRPIAVSESLHNIFFCVLLKQVQ
ncbi:hypothetical protein P9112_000291 [Eukaryota sp. TZLM1-RC]